MFHSFTHTHTQSQVDPNKSGPSSLVPPLSESEESLPSDGKGKVSYPPCTHMKLQIDRQGLISKEDIIYYHHQHDVYIRKKGFSSTSLKSDE